MTTPPERYADLLREPADTALKRLVGALDQALHAVPAPPQIQAALQRAVEQRRGATPRTGRTRQRASSPAKTRSKRAWPLPAQPGCWRSATPARPAPTRSRVWRRRGR